MCSIDKVKPSGDAPPEGFLSFSADQTVRLLLPVVGVFSRMLQFTGVGNPSLPRIPAGHAERSSRPQARIIEIIFRGNRVSLCVPCGYREKYFSRSAVYARIAGVRGAKCSPLQFRRPRRLNCNPRVWRFALTIRLTNPVTNGLIKKQLSLKFSRFCRKWERDREPREAMLCSDTL